MYDIYNPTEYWLYNKYERKYLRKFSSLFEIRNYIESRIRFRDNSSIYMPDDKYYTLADLSMDFDLRFETLYDNLGYKITSKTVPVKYLVIVDRYGSIFNYMEIVNELIAVRNNQKITFGLGRTYPGPSKIENKTRHGFPWGLNLSHKNKHASRPSLIVNKRERTNNYTQHKTNYYDNIADEIAEDLNINVDPKMLKSAFENMRSERRGLSIGTWGGAYAYHDYKYGRPNCWKKNKKSKQWKRERNTDRQTSIRDYIRDCIDKEYDSDEYITIETNSN